MAKRPPTKEEKEAAAIVGTAAALGCFGCILALVKLAFWAVVVWGIVMLVIWVVNK